MRKLTARLSTMPMPYTSVSRPSLRNEVLEEVVGDGGNPGLPATDRDAEERNQRSCGDVENRVEAMTGVSGGSGVRARRLAHIATPEVLVPQRHPGAADAKLEGPPLLAPHGLRLQHPE